MKKDTITALSICLNVLLLIDFLRQPPDVPCLSPTVTFHCQCPAFESRSVVQSIKESLIRSTQESLYVMYGEGNFTDSDEHLLSYIRSMTSRQGPGRRRLSTYVPNGDYSQLGGSQFVDELLKRRRNGFFVECGAFDGEDLSDTLFFELKRNWTGILIEANPEYHQKILRKNRRALVLRGCLNTKPRPGLVKFSLDGWGSGVTAFNKNDREKNRIVSETDVQCFSLNSIMAAIGVRHIDFMVLDVEGSELPVLETIDFTQLSIDVFSIEYSERLNRTSKLEKIRNFFNRTGSYKEVGTLPLGAKDDVGQDVLFMCV